MGDQSPFHLRVKSKYHLPSLAGLTLFTTLVLMEWRSIWFEPQFLCGHCGSRLLIIQLFGLVGSVLSRFLDSLRGGFVALRECLEDLVLAALVLE